MTTPAPSELVAVVTDGAPSADGGSPKGTGLMPAADPAPGESLSEDPRYRSLHRTAVSFVSCLELLDSAGFGAGMGLSLPARAGYDASGRQSRSVSFLSLLGAFLLNVIMRNQGREGAF